MLPSIKNIEETISRQNYISELLECQQKLLQSVITHDEQIGMLAYQQIGIDKDISDLLRDVNRTEYKAIYDLMLNVRMVNEEIEAVERIRSCFEISRLIFPTGYHLCYDCLIMKYTWDYITHKHRISRANISVYKARELSLVLILYCMHETDYGLIEKWSQRYSIVQQKSPDVNLAYIVKYPGCILTTEEMQRAVWNIK